MAVPWILKNTQQPNNVMRERLETYYLDDEKMWNGDAIGFEKNKWERETQEKDDLPI